MIDVSGNEFRMAHPLTDALLPLLYSVSLSVHRRQEEHIKGSLLYLDQVMFAEQNKETLLPVSMVTLPAGSIITSVKLPEECEERRISEHCIEIYNTTD